MQEIKIIDGHIIEDCAMMGYKEKAVIIPKNVDFIGDMAFFGSKNLETVVLPKGLSFFR